MTYKTQQGTSKRFNGYRWTMWLFIMISVVLAFVALHTAQPLDCRDIVRLDDGTLVCQVVIESEDS